MNKKIASLFLLAPVTLYSASVIQFSNVTSGSGNFSNPAAVITGLDLDGDLSNDDSIRGNAWNSSVALNNGVGSYTGPDLYGALVGERLNASAGGWDTRSLTFSWRFQESTNETASYGFGLYRNTTNPLGFSFGTGSFMAFSEDATGSVDGLNRTENYETRRFLVEDINGILYVGQTQFGDNSDTRVLNETELAAENWAVFSPSTGTTATDLQTLKFDPSSSYSVSTADLNAIGLQGFGWAVADANYDDGTRNWFQYNRFYVDAVGIPEPSSIMLMGMGFFAACALRRRKRLG